MCRLSNHLLLATVETPWRRAARRRSQNLAHTAALAVSTDGAGFGQRRTSPSTTPRCRRRCRPPRRRAGRSPAAAVTLRASNLAPTGALRCAFGSLGVVRASLVGGTAARCEAPPAAAAHTAEVRLSHDGGASWSAPLRFTYVNGAPPALHRARPSALAAAAAAGAPRTIALVGENFVVGGSGARCAFGSVEVAATVDSARGARCAAPAGGASRTVPLRLLLPGGASTAALPFTFVGASPPRIASVAPAAADLSAPPLRWTIVGDGFAPPAYGLRCAVGGVVGVAAFTNATHASCEVAADAGGGAPPALRPGASRLVLTVGDGDGGSGAAAEAPLLLYDSLAPPELDAVTPAAVDVRRGGGTLTLSGFATSRLPTSRACSTAARQRRRRRCATRRARCVRCRRCPPA